EKMSEIWQKKLPELMVTDPTKFEEVKTAINGYEAVRDSADAKIQQTASKLGVKQPEKFANAIAISDPNKRAQALKPLMNTFYTSLLSTEKGSLGDWLKTRNAMKYANR